MNTKSVVLLLLATIITCQAFAQKDYVILLTGDTIKGEVRLYSYDNIDRVSIKSGGKKSNLTAQKVRGFAKGGTSYQPMTYEQSLRFMKVIKSGYLSLFAFNAASQGTWDGRYLGKRDGSTLEVPNLAFKKMLSKYLSDCPEIASKIENGDFAKRDIEKIVDEYNACLQSKTSATVKTVETISSINEKTKSISKLREKIEAENFLTKKDVLDLLQDVQNKVTKNETVPNFLIDGLRSYLADTPALLKEADELISLLKK